ncbi:MAG: DUF4831 family protein [Bacteroidia bacterium]|nr:DUF4831 family protein [Bacteroidia bacterium]
MKNFFSKIILILIVLTACSSIKVVNIKQLSNLKDYGLVYNLPKTALNIKIELTAVVQKKGIYADYAEKFLGIKDVITSDKTEWYISNVSLNSYPLPDNDQYYWIQTKGEKIRNNILLTPEGYIVSVNKPIETNTCTPTPVINLTSPPSPSPSHPPTDLSIKNFFKEVKKTSYKEVKTDTTMKKIPVYLSSNERKTTEEKAEEAANFIFKLRKRRFKLLVGMSDNKAAEGQGIESMILELNKTEDEYIALFTGTKLTETYNYALNFIPEINNDSKKIVLFKYSKTKGILPANANEGQALVIEISRFSNISSLGTILQNQEKLAKVDKGLVYRIPDYATVKIFENEKEIFSQEILLAQYGTNMVIPVNMMKRTHKCFEFYHEYGMLKTITSSYSQKKHRKHQVFHH